MDCCFLNVFVIILSALQLPFEVGVTDVSALSVKIGAVGALLVLPAAAAISILFRRREIQLRGSEPPQRSDCSGGEFQRHGSPEKVCGCCVVPFLFWGGGFSAWFEVLHLFQLSCRPILKTCFFVLLPTDVLSVIDGSPHHHHSRVQLWPHESGRKKYPLTPQASLLSLNTFTLCLLLFHPCL